MICIIVEARASEKKACKGIMKEGGTFCLLKKGEKKLL